MKTQHTKPSGWFYLLGLTIFLFGCVAATTVFAVGMVSTVDSALDLDRLISDFDRVVVPGSAQLVLDEPGSYAVFYEYRSIVGGVPFHSSRSRPQLKCDLQTKATGEHLPLINAWLQESNYDLPNRSGTLLMRFEVDRPDTYILSCESAGGSDSPEMVLAVGTGFLRSAVDLAGSVVLGLLVPVVLVFGAGSVAVLIIAIVALRRYQAAKHTAGEGS